jgi:ribosomal protein L11 methyltransferase
VHKRRNRRFLFHSMLVWRKLTSAKWEDAWAERLAFVDASRMAIIGLPGRRAIRIEVYALSKKEAGALVKQFGGQLRTLKDRLFTRQETKREPIRIREKLLVTASKRQASAAERKYPGRKILVVPAAMAFGTGEHATTAACLRFLADLADKLPAGSWDMLDLGTGSGILALAAKTMGARKVNAYDFDPNALRVARENAVLNGIAGIEFKKTEVTQWTPLKTWDVVTANLFSEVLILAAPRIAAAMKPGGRLVFSGVMRHQERECVKALTSMGFRVGKTVRRGKWVTTLARMD